MQAGVHQGEAGVSEDGNPHQEQAAEASGEHVGPTHPGDGTPWSGKEREGAGRLKTGRGLMVEDTEILLIRSSVRAICFVNDVCLDGIWSVKYELKSNVDKIFDSYQGVQLCCTLVPPSLVKIMHHTYMSLIFLPVKAIRYEEFTCERLPIYVCIYYSDPAFAKKC